MKEITEATYQPSVELIACAQLKYGRQEAQLTQLAATAKQHRAVVPDDVARILKDASEDLNAAAASLEQPPKPGKAIPSRTIGQVREASDLITTLAKGEFDGYGYDRDMVNQRIALAMTT